MNNNTIFKKFILLIKGQISLLKFRSDRISALKAAKGLWANRNDLPDFAALRKEFNGTRK